MHAKIQIDNGIRDTVTYPTPTPTTTTTEKPGPTDEQDTAPHPAEGYIHRFQGTDTGKILPPTLIETHNPPRTTGDKTPPPTGSPTTKTTGTPSGAETDRGPTTGTPT